MIINHTHRFIFLHVPKTAGTSVTSWLSNYTGWNDIELGGTHYGEEIQAIYGRRFKLHKHSPAAQVRAVIGEHLWDSYFKFAIVRHPFDRLVSAYRFYLQWDHPSTAPARAFDTFEDFVLSEYFDRDRRNSTRATGSQARFLDVGAARPLDLVCRFEQLQSDMATVAERIGVEAPELPHINSSNRADAEDGVTPRVLDLVADVYAEDFSTFGYRK